MRDLTNLAARDSRMPLALAMAGWTRSVLLGGSTFEIRPTVSSLQISTSHEEWWGLRAMRHVFYVKPNASVQARSLGRAEGTALLARVPAVKRPPPGHTQGRTTILQPVIKCSYPGQYVLTLDTPEQLLADNKTN